MTFTLLAAVVAGALIGLSLGALVGGGGLVVHALLVALGLPLPHAAGTSLVVIAITSAAALVTRASSGIAPDWWLVAALTVTAVAGSVAGVRVAARTDTARLSAAFTGLVLIVAAYTVATAIPALI